MYPVSYYHLRINFYPTRPYSIPTNLFLKFLALLFIYELNKKYFEFILKQQ